MSNWFKRIREYDRVVGEREAAKTALAASRAQRGQEAAARIERVTELEAEVRRLGRQLEQSHGQVDNLKHNRDQLYAELEKARHDRDMYSHIIDQLKLELEQAGVLLADANESLAETIESEAQLAKDLAAERELIAKLDQDNAQLAGQLADAKAQLASYTLAAAIDDETRAKRYYDGLGDE